MFRDPCLLTYEAAQLADWLDSLARGTPSSEEVGLLHRAEHLVSVGGVAGGRPRVYFELEARPP